MSRGPESKLQRIKKEQRGAAMVVVLCVMAVFLALSITILLSASVALNSAKQNVLSEQCRIQAVTFSDLVDDAMEDTKSELGNYLKKKMTAGWEAYQENGQDTAVEKLQIGDTYFPMTMEMYWIPAEESAVLEEGKTVYNGRQIFIDVICTMDGADYHVQSRYTLTSRDEKAPEEEEWKWTLQGRK